MVEHRPVKAIVAGSSPASGAKIIVPAKGWGFYFAVLETRTSNRRFGVANSRTGASAEKMRKRAAGSPGLSSSLSLRAHPS